jgi:hypothetical protein
VEELRLLAPEHAQRDAEQGVEAIEDVPHVEKHLTKKEKNKQTSGFGPSTHARQGERAHLNEEAVREEGEEPEEADRGAVDAERGRGARRASARPPAPSTSGHARKGSSVGEKNSSRRMRSNASYSACTSSSVDATNALAGSTRPQNCACEQ